VPPTLNLQRRRSRIQDRVGGTVRIVPLAQKLVVSAPVVAIFYTGGTRVCAGVELVSRRPRLWAM